MFPNKRSSVFFRKYLGECAARDGRAMLCPSILTMNDLFHEASGAAPTGQVRLLLELYASYCALNPQAESLDDFIFWGDMLLSDFDDVDKYLVNPSGLFRNIADYRGMLSDPDSYMDETQKAALERFLEHFKTGGRYKEAFRHVWDILLPLYADFNARLEAKGFCYEGQVYRRLAERLRDEAAVDVLAPLGHAGKFVFVGLNALNECERRLMRGLRNAGMAEFCWDYGSAWIRDPQNKSSFFMAGNVEEFPQAFPIDEEGLPRTEFNVLSVPSSVGQAKQLPSILDRMGSTGLETAVVLPDESMLMPVLNSIPERISDINVTMGYPMSGSSLWDLMNSIGSLQMHMRQKDGRWFFYHRQVWAIFSNSIFKTVAGEEGRPVMARIKESARYYIPAEEFAGHPFFELVFRPVATAAGEASAEVVAALEDYQCGILSEAASLLKGAADMAVELDFAKEYYTAISQLRDCGLSVLPQTYLRLVDKLVCSRSVPFRGEPLKGLQILGPLETRSLDFDRLVILGCNEGVFPRRNMSSSFIPAELRRGFGLPTYEYQDAVWAYYFYRMIQRAGTVWMVFDSRAELSRSGEESRYIKQLELHFGARVNRYVLKADISRPQEEQCIEKTEADMALLHSRPLSASALQGYLSCPAKFYYGSVLALRPREEVAESLDAGMIGNVFHSAMQSLYTVGGGLVSAEYLKSLLSGERVRGVVREGIMRELNTFEVSGKNLIFEDMVCRYVTKTIQRDIELLASRGRDSFRILGLELRKTTSIGGFRFVGYIDRLDSIEPGEVRVVDYKTGRVTDSDFIIDESNAESVVAALFGDDEGKRPKIALQLYLYDRFIAGDENIRGLRVVNSIYQTSRLFVRQVENVALCGSFYELMDGKLAGLLAEIDDLSVPFSRTSDLKTCAYCDFKMICGR